MVLQVLQEDLPSVESTVPNHHRDPIFPVSVRWILENPDSIEILEVSEEFLEENAEDEDDESADDEGEKEIPEAIGIHVTDFFDEYRIHGSTLVPNSSRRRAVGQALIAANRNNSGRSLCFDAHIGIRAIRNGQKVEMLICFWCGNVCVSGPENVQGMYPIGRSAEKLIRRELWRGGVGWLFFWRRWLP